MKRQHRLGLVGIAVASSVAVIGLLTSFSAASEGPIVTALDRLGTVLGSMESGIRQRLGGLGRSRELAWLTPYRIDANRLRDLDIVLFGAYDSTFPETFDGIVELERSIETTFPLVHIYTAWGDKPDQQFPLRVATAIWNIGSLAVITWEPWLTDFENVRHPSLPLREARDRHGMAAVSRGDYDFYVDAWAADAARYGKPLFVRLGHEMNDPYRYPWGPQNNTKEEYIAAWQHVFGRFRQAGAHNVIWVWSPHIAHAYWETYYPGDDYVDWVATGALNFGPVAHWSQWWTFHELFGTKYQQLAAFGKPIMLAEFGSLAVGGDRAAWYRNALADLPRKHPAVKALLFFDADNDRTVTYQKLDWSVAHDTAIAQTIAAAIRSWSPENSRR